MFQYKLQKVKTEKRKKRFFFILFPTLLGVIVVAIGISVALSTSYITTGASGANAAANTNLAQSAKAGDKITTSDGKTVEVATVKADGTVVTTDGTEIKPDAYTGTASYSAGTNATAASQGSSASNSNTGSSNQSNNSDSWKSSDRRLSDEELMGIVDAMPQPSNSSTGSSNQSSGSSATTDPNAGKTWHEAYDEWVVDVPGHYEIVHHDAEIRQRAIYKDVYYDGTLVDDDPEAIGLAHGGGYWGDVLVGYEDYIAKEAYDEQVWVAEQGHNVHHDGCWA